MGAIRCGTNLVLVAAARWSRRGRIGIYVRTVGWSSPWRASWTVTRRSTLRPWRAPCVRGRASLARSCVVTSWRTPTRNRTSAMFATRHSRWTNPSSSTPDCTPANDRSLAASATRDSATRAFCGTMSWGTPKRSRSNARSAVGSTAVATRSRDIATCTLWSGAIAANTVRASSTNYPVWCATGALTPARNPTCVRYARVRSATARACVDTSACTRGSDHTRAWPVTRRSRSRRHSRVTRRRTTNATAPRSSV